MDEFFAVLGDAAVRVRMVPQAELPTGSHLGLSDVADGAGLPQIWVSGDISGQTLLAVLLHEALHLAAPYLDEDTVEQLGSQLAQVATLAGFRREAN